jgi:septal ring factor EnvC (AmiA/AmiB activator)
MDHTRIIADLRAEIEAQKQRIASMERDLERRACELDEVRQRLELRSISLERLQSQFTLAAEAVNKLLINRETIRRSPWGRLGSVLGFLPKFGDDL